MEVTISLSSSKAIIILQSLEAFHQDDLDGGLHLESFIDKLCEIANQTIPKSNPNPKKPQKPWFSDKCKEAILE